MQEYVRCENCGCVVRVGDYAAACACCSHYNSPVGGEQSVDDKLRLLYEGYVQIVQRVKALEPT